MIGLVFGILALMVTATLMAIITDDEVVSNLAVIVDVALLCLLLLIVLG